MEEKSGSQTSGKQPMEIVEDVPDPDEDDLDDLDDMLDEFSTVNLESKQLVEPAGPGRPADQKADKPAEGAGSGTDDVLTDEDFAKQLQNSMANLLGELENSPEMQAQFDSIFKQVGQAVESELSASDPGMPLPSADYKKEAEDSTADGSFQETIKRTIERMQASGDQATAAAEAEGSDDFLAEMMKQLGSGGPDGQGSEEEFSKMLMGMMEQLTNKEILYEPMKELNERFPKWLAENKDKVSSEDLKRYEEQRGIVLEIVAKFEETGFSDSNPSDREYIVERMQKMQAAGSPPPDLVGDMPSAQEVLNAPDETCNPQ